MSRHGSSCDFCRRRIKDKKVFIKVTVLLMLDSGCTVEFIAETLGTYESTIFHYTKGWLKSNLIAYLASIHLAN